MRSGDPQRRARQAALAPRLHGGALAGELAALGVDPREVLDFSANVNPYGPAPAVLAAIRAAPVHVYPDPSARAVREAIARATGRAAEAVVFGSGAADLIWTLARALFSPGDRALVCEPAFSEFRAAAEAAGAEVVAWRMRPERAPAFDPRAAAARARRAGACAVYLATPAAATGAAVPVAAVAELALALEGVLVVLDESFQSLSDTSDEASAPLPENVVRLRSMTKEHALPGLRAGYLLATGFPPPLLRRAARGRGSATSGAPAFPLAAAVEACRPAWSTSSLAQAAALAALGEKAFVAASRARLRRDREATAAELRALGFRPLPSVAPYLCFRVGGAAEAAALRQRVLGRGVLVRDCASFGLPGHLRVAARPAAERARLAAALRSERP